MLVLIHAPCEIVRHSDIERRLSLIRDDICAKDFHGILFGLRTSGSFAALRMTENHKMTADGETRAGAPCHSEGAQPPKNPE